MNLPNKITLARIILIPFIIFFYLATFIPFAKLIALVLFVIAVLTDFLDGKLARKLGQVTTTGVFMDTIADKMLNLSVFALIMVSSDMFQPVGVISFIIILCRELIVSALRQLAATKNVVIKADMLGKIKATIQFVTIALFLLLAFLITIVPSESVFITIMQVVCYVSLGVTVAITIVSGLNYLIKNRQVFSA